MTFKIIEEGDEDKDANEDEDEDEDEDDTHPYFTEHMPNDEFSTSIIPSKIHHKHSLIWTWDIWISVINNSGLVVI